MREVEAASDHSATLAAWLAGPAVDGSFVITRANGRRKSSTYFSTRPTAQGRL